jgi:hypothetical protein
VIVDQNRSLGFVAYYSLFYAGSPIERSLDAAAHGGQSIEGINTLNLALLAATGAVSIR